MLLDSFWKAGQD